MYGVHLPPLSLSVCVCVFIAAPASLYLYPSIVSYVRTASLPLHPPSASTSAAASLLLTFTYFAMLKETMLITMLILVFFRLPATVPWPKGEIDLLGPGY